MVYPADYIYWVAGLVGLGFAVLLGMSFLFLNMYTYMYMYMYSSFILSLSLSFSFSITVVNYRGSSGFGQDSIMSLPGNVGKQDVQDVHVGGAISALYIN